MNQLVSIRGVSVRFDEVFWAFMRHFALMRVLSIRKATATPGGVLPCLT